MALVAPSATQPPAVAPKPPTAATGNRTVLNERPLKDKQGDTGWVVLDTKATRT